MSAPNKILERTISELSKLYEVKSKTKNENDKELLEITIKELHRLYDHVSNSFDHLRTKALALMGGEVAILTFLFSANGNSSKTFFHKSAPIYGVVFYGIGIALLVGAFSAFLYVISTVSWQHPPDEKDVANVTDRFNHDVIRFLNHLISEYIESINHCIKVINLKSGRFMWGVYALSLGIFIMVMLKFGGGIIKI